MFEDMNRFIVTTGFEPEIDHIFAFDDAPEAYAYQDSGRHFEKVVVSIDQ